jgi:hypothetical protein
MKYKADIVGVRTRRLHWLLIEAGAERALYFERKERAMEPKKIST